MDDSSPQYQASKGAVRLLTRLTAFQYARAHPGQFGAPRPIVTAMTERRRADPAVYQRMVSAATASPTRSPTGVLYLASDESSFVTGSELMIDGGRTAQ